jgi:hypothetical protein
MMSMLVAVLMSLAPALYNALVLTPDADVRRKGGRVSLSLKVYP